MNRRQSLLAGLVLGLSFGLWKIYPLQELDFVIEDTPQPEYGWVEVRTEVRSGGIGGSCSSYITVHFQSQKIT